MADDGRRVIGRAGLQQRDDLAAALAGALDDAVQLLLGGPAHLDEVGQRHAGHGRVAHHRHHVVAMAAQRHGRHVFHRHLELFGQEIAEARGVQHAGHADDVALRQAGEFLQRPHHRVERVGDADDKALRRVFLDAGADLLHHLEVDAQQVVAAHARLARHAGGDDANIRALDAGIVVDALIAGIEPFHRRGFGDVQTLALRQALGDVEHHHVAQFLQADQMCECAADHAGADEGDLFACHVWKYSLV